MARQMQKPYSMKWALDCQPKALAGKSGKIVSLLTPKSWGVHPIATRINQGTMPLKSNTVCKFPAREVRETYEEIGIHSD